MDLQLDKTYSLLTADANYDAKQHKAVKENLAAIEAEMQWLSAIVEERMQQMVAKTEENQPVENAPPKLKKNKSAYARLIQQHALNTSERLLLILAFAPYYNPAMLTAAFRDDEYTLRVKHPEVGGTIKPGSRQFVPSMQTFQFLLGGKALQQATETVMLLRATSPLFKHGILREISTLQGNGMFNDHEELLTVTHEYVHHLRSSRDPEPRFSESFPARKIETNYEWEDVVMHPLTKSQLNPLLKWLKHHEELAKQSSKWRIMAPILFYGPPGTGKTLTAQLIGKMLGKQVYAVDLSMLVSKYVGETEKHIRILLEHAQRMGHVLFFDEADGLFAKRTQVHSANDKWANMSTNFLLTSMENYEGICILATNHRSNLDTAMARRFRYMVHFPRPKQEERAQLWKTLLPQHYTYANDVDVMHIAREDLTGANIANIVLDVAVMATDQGTNTISDAMITDAVRRELFKEDRTPNHVGLRKPEFRQPEVSQSNYVEGTDHGKRKRATAPAIPAGTAPEKPENMVALTVEEMHIIRRFRKGR